MEELREHAQQEAIGEEVLRFLMLDIDRTTILPRGLCDSEIDSARKTAVQSYVEGVLGSNAVNDAVAFARDFKNSEYFPPYAVSGDEDQRALATLLMRAGLLEMDDCARPPQVVEKRENLDEWLGCMLERIQTRMPNAHVLSSHLKWVRWRHGKDIGTLLPKYREQEELAFRSLGDQFKINGHIVKMLKELCDLGVTPIGYSDRPGISMGLDLYPTYTAWPRDEDSSLIMRSVPLAWEETS